MCGIVGACAGCRHVAAGPAEERVLEPQGEDPDLFRIEGVENPLSVECALEATHTSMIATHYEMSAAVVLPGDRVEHRLPRSCIAHGGGKDR